MKDLTSGNIYRTFFWFAIPMVLAGLLSQGYNIVDTVLAGKLLGTSGLAAVGATAALITVVSSVFWGFNTGFSIYIARCFGAKEYEKIKASIYSNYIMLFVVSTIVSAVLITCRGAIFDLLNVDTSIRQGATEYFVIYIAGLFFVIFNFAGTHIMNAFGISDFPLYMSIFSAVLNIAGNLFLVAIMNMGVAGLAVATVLSAFITTICYLMKIRKCFIEMGVHTVHIKPGIKYIKDAFSMSVTVTAQQMIMYFAPFLIAPYVNAIGGAATAAYAVVLQIYDINAEIYQNSAKSLSNYAAQCVGAKKYSRIKKGIKVGFFQGLIFVAPTLLFCTIFAKTACSIFFPKGEAGDALSYTILFARIYLPFILFNVVNNLFHAFFRGVKALKSLILCTSFAAVVRLCVSLVLIPRWGMSGVYIGWAASWISEAILAVSIYLSGKWQSDEIREGIKK